MKTGIHPTYHDVQFICACGAKFTAGSTLEGDEFHTEICSKCHPFYTGKQKLIDTSGRVDKFRAKLEKAKKAQAEAEKKLKPVDEDEEIEETEESTKEEEKTKEPTTDKAETKEKNKTVEEKPETKEKPAKKESTEEKEEAPKEEKE